MRSLETWRAAGISSVEEYNLGKAMQTKGKLFEDLAQLMTNAMGVAQGARQEFETGLDSWLDRWLASRNLVTRDEFESVQMMARKAREENELLAQRIKQLEQAHNGGQPHAASAATQSDSDEHADSQ